VQGMWGRESGEEGCAGRGELPHCRHRRDSLGTPPWGSPAAVAHRGDTMVCTGWGRESSEGGRAAHTCSSGSERKQVAR
jgi:hypothetical protein